MADYINKNILSQAYIHIEVDDDDVFDQDSFRESLIAFTRERARFFLYSEVELDVEFDEGSVKARITVLGALYLLMQGVTHYKDFREGSILIFDDAKRLSEYLISESLFEARARHEQVIRVEARTGVVGSLRTIIGKLDALREGNGKNDEKWMSSKIAGVREDVENLVERLKTGEDREFVRQGLLKQAKKLPVEPAPKPKRKSSPEAAAVYRDERKRLLDALAATAN